MRKNCLTLSAIVLVLAAVPAYAESVPSVPAPAVPADSAPAEMSFDSLLKAYAKNNTALFTGSEELTAAWAQKYNCKEFLATRKNEFDAPATLDKAKAEIAALPAAPGTYAILTGARFGSYDRAKEQFPFALIEPGQGSVSFKFDSASNRSYGYALNGGLACVPQNVSGWPEGFEVTLTNAHAINGINLPVDAAKAFLEKNPNRGVNVRLVVKPTEWGSVTMGKSDLPLKAEVIAADLLTEKGEVVYSYDAATLAATIAGQEKEKADAAAAAAVAPIAITGADWTPVKAWVARLKGNGPDTLPDGTKLRELQIGWGHFLSDKVSATTGINFEMVKDIHEPVSQDGTRVAGDGRNLVVTVINAEEFYKPVTLTPEQYQAMKPRMGRPGDDTCYGSCSYSTHVVLQPVAVKEEVKKGSPHFNIPDETISTLQTKIVRLVVTPTKDGKPNGMPPIIVEAK